MSTPMSRELQLAHEAQAPLPAETSSTGDAMLDMIQRLATDPSADVDKLERLIALHERTTDKRRQVDREEAFNAAMVAAQAEMGPVVRDRHNDQTRSRYATLDAIARAIAPIYTSHGFAPTFGEADSPIEGHLRITCTLMHSSGGFRDYHTDLPMDQAGIAGKVNKTALHARGSTKSYGRRYLLLDIFNVATADDDGNAGGAGQIETINADQFRELKALIEEMDCEAAFLAHAQVEALHELPARHFAQAKQMLVSRKRKMGGGDEA